MGNSCSCSKDYNTFEYSSRRNCDYYKDFPIDIVECSIIDNSYF